MKKIFCIGMLALICSSAAHAALQPVELRTEWLVNPVGIEASAPRVSWRVESEQRGQRQTAYRLLVASDEKKLQSNQGDLWDSGKVASDETLNIAYAGKPLASGQRAFWKLKVWEKDGKESAWSEPASWSMGLLKPEDWKAEWISYKDTSPLHTKRDSLFLPPASHYRKQFKTKKEIKRATVYGSALGIFELHVNGQRVGDAWFEPGWADYLQRAYYTTHDVTGFVKAGQNAIGFIVAEGWYSGYVGYGLLVGYGPNKVGRYFYGKTPALLAQLVIEYSDGTREIIGTDSSWNVTNDGPIREADMIMGEAYDARRQRDDWCTPDGAKEWKWQAAIRAQENGSTKATFSDNEGNREVELGFQRPPKMQAYTAPPIRVTEELQTRRITEPSKGVYIFDLGQNFAGNIRLKVSGPAGTKLQLRFGEMLHPDGRLMTENLRRARATDFYTLRGSDTGAPETWQPSFTYHGFQYVEITGLSSKPAPDMVTGLVLHNDTPLVGSFECADDVINKLAQNAQWTQRANFIEIPTDCPQRDERLGWTGDAQTYIRTATFNADVAAFFTKWFDDLEEAQRSFGAYPDYAPYPMGHGEPKKTFGTAWTDAGVICPWTVWKVYGDTRMLNRHWDSMTRFMDWRAANTTPDGLGKSIGNTWGDWLNVNEKTPIEFIDTAYHALVCTMMSEMADALGRKGEAENYRKRFAKTKTAFNKAYVSNDGTLKVDTQTAYVLALWVGLLPEDKVTRAANTLAEKISKNGNRMATGFLGTRALLPALSANGQHDLAVQLFQSRQFPSWGYAVVNGANTIWERWDSYTEEHGFNGADGKQNAAMNSFSHYAFGAVMEWAYRVLAGIDTDGSGYKRIFIQPNPPSSNATTAKNAPQMNWVRAEYGSARGKITSAWKMNNGNFELNVTIPANTTAIVSLPTRAADAITEGGKPLKDAAGVKFLRVENDRAILEVGSGDYRFVSLLNR
ncbi:MAG: family 78 glycoside hydrolase catalytic domain [Verrucomicrobia bacterium]|nr:family 78 glycoside hydrolase catalytic domain [Verrucomicrobiota bacterium]